MEREMKKILMKYMTRFTTLNEEEQQAIVEDVQIEEYKRNNTP